MFITLRFIFSSIQEKYNEKKHFYFQPNERFFGNTVFLKFDHNPTAACIFGMSLYENSFKRSKVEFYILQYHVYFTACVIAFKHTKYVCIYPHVTSNGDEDPTGNSVVLCLFYIHRLTP